MAARSGTASRADARSMPTALRRRGQQRPRPSPPPRSHSGQRSGRSRFTMHLHKMHKFHKMHHQMMHYHRGPPRFNDAEDEALISAVRQFPSLYDSHHEDYKNGKVKTDIWDNIALLLNRDVETCKRRWKDIKDNYYKIKRKHKMGNCKWPLVGKLAFLDSAGPERRMGPCRFERDRLLFSSPETNPLTGVENEKEFIEESVPIDIATPGTSREKEFHQDRSVRFSRQQVPQRHQQDDDVDLFMQSIALQVKKLPPQIVARAKLNILTTVHDLQFETESNIQNLLANEIQESVSELVAEK